MFNLLLLSCTKPLWVYIISMNAKLSTGVLKGYVYHHQYRPVLKEIAAKYLNYQRDTCSSLPR